MSKTTELVQCQSPDANPESDCGVTHALTHQSGMEVHCSDNTSFYQHDSTWKLPSWGFWYGLNKKKKAYWYIPHIIHLWLTPQLNLNIIFGWPKGSLTIFSKLPPIKGRITNTSMDFFWNDNILAKWNNLILDGHQSIWRVLLERVD